MIKSLMNLFEKAIEKYSPTPTFYNIEEFAFIHDLVTNKKAIVEEFERVKGIKPFKEISPETAPDKYFKNANWNVYFLKAYNTPIEENIINCPVTYRIINKHKDIVTAMFSILPPGSEMDYHRGPYKGVLRCLFKLKLDDLNGNAGLIVRDKEIQWNSTECVIFDDTLRHKAWNHSKGTRVVLFLDIIRKLPFWLNLANKIFLLLVQRNKRIKQIYLFYKDKNNYKD